MTEFLRLSDAHPRAYIYSLCLDSNTESCISLLVSLRELSRHWQIIWLRNNRSNEGRIQQRISHDDHVLSWSRETYVVDPETSYLKGQRRHYLTFMQALGKLSGPKDNFILSLYPNCMIKLRILSIKFQVCKMRLSQT